MAKYLYADILVDSTLALHELDLHEDEPDRLSTEAGPANRPKLPHKEFYQIKTGGIDIVPDLMPWRFQ